MDIGVTVLSLVVGLFGVASAVLGFIAERTKFTPHDIDVDFNGECDYPANPAYLLALLAIPLLAVAMIIASLAGGCCGCCRPRHGASESKRIIGIVCAVFSWIAALIAGVIYANGVAWNLPVTRYDSNWCRLLKDGYLRLAAWLSLAATALAITSYSMLRARAAPAAATRSTAPAPAAAGASGPSLMMARTRRLRKPSRFRRRRSGRRLLLRHTDTGKGNGRSRRSLGTLWEDTVGHHTVRWLPLLGVKHSCNT